jgi:glycosyltransferase involved in cell wall biosynthesis
MKKTPLVSIIIPVYNEEEYLDFCLSSLTNQSYPKKEIIVIDDGSTDNSLKICKKYDAQILPQRHQGPGAARNLGVAHAKGEIIVLADADMKYEKKYIENLIKPILSGVAVGTFVKEEYVANPENIWSRCWSINAGLPQNRRLPQDYPDTENAFRAILKKYFLQGEGYDIHEGYCDDSSLSRKINIKAKNAPSAISYHFNPSSLSEVFYSARWIGRSILFRPSIITLLRYSSPNSLRVSIKYIKKGAPYAIIPFKVVYDFGMFVGIFLGNGKREK